MRYAVVFIANSKSLSSRSVYHVQNRNTNPKSKIGFKISGINIRF